MQPSIIFINKAFNILNLSNHHNYVTISLISLIVCSKNFDINLKQETGSDASKLRLHGAMNSCQMNKSTMQRVLTIISISGSSCRNGRKSEAGARASRSTRVIRHGQLYLIYVQQRGDKTNVARILTFNKLFHRQS